MLIIFVQLKRVTLIWKIFRREIENHRLVILIVYNFTVFCFTTIHSLTHYSNVIAVIFHGNRIGLSNQMSFLNLSVLMFHFPRNLTSPESELKWEIQLETIILLSISYDH